MWSELKNWEVKADFPTPEAPNMATVYWIGIAGSSKRVSAAAPPRHADEALLEPLEALRDEDAEQMGDTSSELVLELLMPEFSIFTLRKKIQKKCSKYTSVSDVLGIGVTK